MKRQKGVSLAASKRKVNSSSSLSESSLDPDLGLHAAEQLPVYGPSAMEHLGTTMPLDAIQTVHGILMCICCQPIQAAFIIKHATAIVGKLVMCSNLSEAHVMPSSIRAETGGIQ